MINSTRFPNMDHNKRRRVRFEREFEKYTKLKREQRKRKRRKKVMDYVVGPGMVAVGTPFLLLSMPAWAPIVIYAMLNTE